LSAMRCPKCQFENREGVKFCEGCGAKMESKCPSCGATAPHKQGVPCYQEKCPKCGAPMTRQR